MVGLAVSSGVTISLAESCTGGFISTSITDVPGASACYLGGLVAYSNEVKVRYLNVPSSTLARKGAVSKETASAMAAGCRRFFGSDMALAVTGIAGPEGGTDEKEIGSVFISVAGANCQITEFFSLGKMDRKAFKEEVSERALGMIMGLLRKGL